MGAKKGIILRQIRSVRFYKYFLSYLFLLVVILLLLGTVVYKSFISTLRQEVEVSNIASLNQITAMMDMRFKELDRTAFHIYTNPQLRAYNVMESNYNALQAVGELGKYKSSNEFVDDIILYHDYDGKKRLFSSTRDADIDTFFNYLTKYENWSKEEFLNFFSKGAKPVIRSVETIYYNNVQSRFATYVYPLPISSAVPTSAVMYLIEENTLFSMLRSALNDYDGFAYILDEGGKPIAYISKGESNVKVLDLLDQLNKVKQGGNIDSIKVLNESYSVVREHSEYNRWSYITVIKTDQLMKKVYTKRSLFNYAAFIVLLLGVIIAFTMATSSYKPLGDIAERITEYGGQSNSKGSAGEDELELISTMFDRISSENKGLMSQLENKAGMMREQMLRRMFMKSNLDLDEVRNLCDLSGTRLDFPCFEVLMFLIDDYSNITVGSDERTVELLKFSITNVVEELAAEIGYGYGLEMEEGCKIAVLMNFKTEYDKERYISGLAYRAKNFFMQHFGVTLTVGIGKTYDDISSVRKSFQEANRAVYFRLVKGKNNVIFYEDIRDIHRSVYKYPIDKENQLILAIRQGKSEEVKTITEEFKAYIIEQELRPEPIQYIFFGFVNAVIKTLDEMDIELSKSFETEKEKLFTEPFETIDELGNRITAFCSEVCTYIEKNKESKNFELREKILDIINRRYNDNNLTLEGIADECGVSSVYVSRYFKDQTGYTLMKYIDTLRMNKAKELLKNTNLVIKEILQQVGYVDEANFMRKFKKNEGITPTQYRSVACNSVNNDE